MMLDTDALKWVRVANCTSEIPFNENGIAEVAADGRKLCIAFYKDRYFAFAPKCPHASGLLVNGYMDALGNIVCPVHRYKFCLTNGRNVSGEGYYLKHWPIAIEEDGVYVGLEKSRLFGLL